MACGTRFVKVAPENESSARNDSDNLEAVAILKTVKGLQDEVHRALGERHPYETPVILFIEPTGADAATLEWLIGETAGSRP